MNDEIHKDLHHQRATKIPPNVCYLTIYNLTSWNPLGHSRPVMGLLYLYNTQHQHIIQLI